MINIGNLTEFDEGQSWYELSCINDEVNYHARIVFYPEYGSWVVGEDIEYEIR